jgi:5-methylcytosine-specific restriction endonuclease McrA
MKAKGLCTVHYNKAWYAEHGRPKEPWSDAKRDRYHRRRALKRNAATGQPVRLQEIALRDGLRCFCGDVVDMALEWPHPMSKSLDHVVPLSQGGLHDPSNVRLAHLHCNTLRGNRGGGEQLALLG